MEFIIYNKIKDKLLIQYNILNNINLNMKGGLSNIELLEDNLDKLQSIGDIDLLQQNITLFKTQIEELIIKINELLSKTEKIPEMLDPDNKILELYNSELFKKTIDKYNDKIKDVSWTGERLNSEIYLSDPDLQRDDIFLKTTTDDDFAKFNDQLLLLFNPFLNNYEDLKTKALDGQKKGVLDNLDEEIKRINELIEIAKEFDLYIEKKRKNIDKILNVSYNDTDISFVNNSDNKISPADFTITLKEAEVKLESRLDLKNINDIQIKIKEIFNKFEIKNEINDLKYFNILDKTENINDILNIDNTITIVNTTAQKGGTFDTKYITNFETNKKILKLLKLYEKLYDIIEKILSESKFLKEIQYRFNFYISYIFLIIRQSASKDTIVVYKYLSKDKVILYIDILNKIKTKFTNLTKSEPNTIKLNKYHYLIIDKILNVLMFINSKFPSDNHIVEIEKCKGAVLNDLNIFNHFKSIIIQYVNTAEGKLITGLENSNNL